MRKSKTGHLPFAKSRPATDEALAPLTNNGRIFYQASAQTLNTVVRNGVIRSFEKGDVIFEQGERTDNLPLFCVLSGRFDIVHIWGASNRHIATDEAGTLIGDVELLLRGESLDRDESAIRGLSTNQTWAKVQCAAAGEMLSIWPADALLADHAVAVALARSLAKKLLLRSAVADPKAILPKPKQVEFYLRRIARDLVQNDPSIGKFIEIPMSLADIAAEVECAKQTVAAALKDLSEKHTGFTHTRSLIVVPRYFIDQPLELFQEN